MHSNNSIKGLFKSFKKNLAAFLWYAAATQIAAEPANGSIKVSTYSGKTARICLAIPRLLP